MKDQMNETAELAKTTAIEVGFIKQVMLRLVELPDISYVQESAQEEKAVAKRGGKKAKNPEEIRERLVDKYLEKTGKGIMSAEEYKNRLLVQQIQHNEIGYDYAGRTYDPTQGALNKLKKCPSR